METTKNKQIVALILGFGASVRKLNLENEKGFIGKGISYCATCDGNLFKGKTVAIVGDALDNRLSVKTFHLGISIKFIEI